MKTKEELEAIIANAQAELEQLKGWRSRLLDPKKGEYCFIESDSDCCFSTYKEKYRSSRKPEHAFDTLERAELFAKKITLFQEMTNFAYAMNEGWVAKWGFKQVNWGVVMYDDICGIAYYGCVNPFIFGIAVKDEETAGLMLQEFGDRINEIYNLPC
jgi:hypothetical protein